MVDFHLNIHKHRRLETDLRLPAGRNALLLHQSKDVVEEHSENNWKKLVYIVFDGKSRHPASDLIYVEPKKFKIFPPPINNFPYYNNNDDNLKAKARVKHAVNDSNRSECNIMNKANVCRKTIPQAKLENFYLARIAKSMKGSGKLCANFPTNISLNIYRR